MKAQLVFLLAIATWMTVEGGRTRRQLSVPGNACPDANTNVCRSCSCSPSTARFVKSGNTLVAPLAGLPPAISSLCDQCCFQQLLITPQCPIDIATNQARPALLATGNVALQVIGSATRQSYVGCCPFTPCQTGYSCMFDKSNAVWMCCGVGGVVTPPPVDRCASGIPSVGACSNGACGAGFACEGTTSGRQICCPGPVPTPPVFTTPRPTPPITDAFGCLGGTNALIYRTPQGVIPQPAVPVVGCLELGSTRCPRGTTCQAHNRPVTVAWKAGICCVPNGVDQSTIPILV